MNYGYLGKWGKTVCGATGVAHNVLIRFVKLVVNSINVSGSIVLSRSTHNNTFGTFK